MMKTCLILACCGLFFSCNNNTEDTAPEDNNGSPVHCYGYANERDTILLTLIPMGESVTGTLAYSLDGKDRNTGTIQGVMRDDLIVADYTFMSEGIRSVRQVAFMKKDSFYIEGYGEVVVTGKRTQFRNTDSLWFNDSIRLLGTSCQNK